jgi:hypothetical protein
MSTAMKKPLILPLNADAIPAELRALDAWVGWRLAFRRGRWTKEPINLRTCDLAETDNPRTWLDFDTAFFRYAAFGCDGIGLCRTQDQVFIDLDGVLDPAGNLKPFPWASKILSTIQGRAYVERSPTGTGIHGIGLGKLPEGRRQFDDPYLDHTGFALYDANRFLAFTGHALPESGPMRDLTAQLTSLHCELFPKTASRNGAPPSSGVLPPDGELICRAMAAKNGRKFSLLWQGDISDYPSQSEADLALCCHLAFWTGRDAGRIDDLFRRSALYRKDKWGTRQDYRERTIALAIERATETWQPGMNSGSKIDGAETGTSTTNEVEHEYATNGEFRAGTPGPDFGYSPGGEDIGWEPPIDFLCRNPRPFPEDLLPGFLGGQAKAVARATETPIALAGMLGIAVASHVLQAGLKFAQSRVMWSQPTFTWLRPWKVEIERPPFLTLCVSHSWTLRERKQNGLPRKSPAPPVDERLWRRT